MLILRPVGRGNWKVVEMQLSGRHAPLPIEIQAIHHNARIELAGRVYRVVRVHP